MKVRIWQGSGRDAGVEVDGVRVPKVTSVQLRMRAVEVYPEVVLDVLPADVEVELTDPIFHVRRALDVAAMKALTRAVQLLSEHGEAGSALEVESIITGFIVDVGGTAEMAGGVESHQKAGPSHQ